MTDTPSNTVLSPGSTTGSSTVSTPPSSGPDFSVTTATAEVTAKIHGAAQVPENVFWIGHGVGGVLLVVACLCLFFGPGPRRKEALQALINESLAK